MIESPSNNPWMQRFFRKLQYNTVAIDNPQDASFPPDLVEAPLDILRAAIHGDADAYGDIYEIYRQRVLNYCKIRLPNLQDAEDCSQTVWLRVYNKLPNYQMVGIPFRNYLFSAANHVCIDWWRASRHEEPLPDADFNAFTSSRLASRNPEEIYEVKESIEEAQAVLAALPSEMAKAVVYRLNGLSHETIASELNKSADASRQLTSRGLKKVRVAVNLNG